MDRGLIMFSPKIEEGKEPPLPIRISVSFKIDEKPKRMIAFFSTTKMPALSNSAFDLKTAAIWQPDYHAKFYMRQELPFTWDEKLRTANVTLGYGTSQLIWE